MNNMEMPLTLLGLKSRRENSRQMGVVNSMASAVRRKERGKGM
jgi:hypothetical protein